MSCSSRHFVDNLRRPGFLTMLMEGVIDEIKLFQAGIILKYLFRIVKDVRRGGYAGM